MTAAGDEINKIMRFRQKRKERKGKRTGWRGQMKEKAVRQTGRKRGGKKRRKKDVILEETGKVGVENEEVNAVRERAERES